MSSKHAKAEAKEPKKTNKMLYLIIIGIILIIGISVALIMQHGKSAGAGGAGTAGVDADGNPIEVVDNTDAEPAEEVSMDIETEEGNLSYPEKWKDYINTDVSNNDNTTSVKFSTKVDDTEYELFTIEIGDSQGTQVGTIKAADGTEKSVHVIFKELENIDKLSEADKQRLYSMQEDLNYLIDHLN